LVELYYKAFNPGETNIPSLGGISKQWRVPNDEWRIKCKKTILSNKKVLISR
jgi:hypothetical protein